MSITHFPLSTAALFANIKYHKLLEAHGIYMYVLQTSLRYLQELEVPRTNFQYLIFTLDQQVQQFLGVNN